MLFSPLFFPFSPDFPSTFCSPVNFGSCGDTAGPCGICPISSLLFLCAPWMQEPAQNQGMADVWSSRVRERKERMQKGTLDEFDDLDDSLTSLMWLQDFSITNASMGKSSCCPTGPDPHDCQKIPSFAAPCSPLAADPACMGMPHTPCKPISSSTSRTAHTTVAMNPPQLMEDIDYKTNPQVKPPYSYATLICMAMEASEKPKITLAAIYKWITDNFCYFRHADPTWQNSIRHNLSLNKCFIKVPREKGEPGKGGFWKLDPQYADRLKNGAFKKRKVPPVQIHPAFTKNTQQDSPCATSPSSLVCTSNNILNVNVESQQLLKEFEELTGSQNMNAADGKVGCKRKQPLPNRTAKVARVSSSPLLTQEEQTELGSLKGDFDWSAIFDTNLSENFSAFENLELTPPIGPILDDVDLEAHGHIDCPQGQEQVLTESNQANPDLDETLMATAFLENPWDEGTNDCLSNCVNIDQLFEVYDASLPAEEGDWSSLTSLV
ncbi:forkhead box protein J1 [Strigops habroptila]|uniref:Forkhead box J1 n=1 Tax=Strigops habroptila TaxID=2489341 RepID=A0A672VB73_STRHB|nr:forkhead box protein J1 [Strigops habroptila]